MTKDQSELEKESDKLNKDWVKRAKLTSEEIRFIKLRLRNHTNNRTLVEREPISNNYFQDHSDWGIKFKNYLEVESENPEILNPKTAAKLAVSRVNAEQKLVIAIELGKSEYTVCSLVSILQIIEQEDLGKKDRISASILVYESIITAANPIKNTINSAKSNLDCIYDLRFYKQFTKALGAAVVVLASQENFDNSTEELKKLIDITTIEVASKRHKEEHMALQIANERMLTKQRLSKMHQKPIIRSIHHLACTGGTLISKCIAAMPYIALISEINPNNRFGSQFEPTNPLLLLERSYRKLSTSERVESFRQQIRQALEICQKDDVDLILRDHSHTDFHTGSESSQICPIQDYLKDDYDLISVITVRHPLDSYLSLITQGWEKQFYPNDLDEYSKRYLAFLDKYSTLKYIRYEDLCENPLTVMNELCKILEIGYSDNFIKEFGNHELTGDSGRKGLETIEIRPRRPIPKDVEDCIENSKNYLELIHRLGY